MYKTIAHYFSSDSRLTRQKKRILRNSLLNSKISPAFHAYCSSSCPSYQDVVSNLDLVALDFETSGLDPVNDGILSIGYVPMNLNYIEASKSEEIYVGNSQFVNGNAAVINHILPAELADGIPLVEAMDRLFHCLVGKVLLVHGACIELAFIEQYLSREYGISEFPCQVIDTMHIERTLTYTGKTHANHSLTLEDIRHTYGLPTYENHSAAIDALATAELFSAQIKRLFKNVYPKLSDVSFR